jgi:hypothetical protein
LAVRRSCSSTERCFKCVSCLPLAHNVGCRAVQRDESELEGRALQRVRGTCEIGLACGAYGQHSARRPHPASCTASQPACGVRCGCGPWGASSRARRARQQAARATTAAAAAETCTQRTHLGRHRPQHGRELAELCGAHQLAPRAPPRVPKLDGPILVNSLRARQDRLVVDDAREQLVRERRRVHHAQLHGDLAAASTRRSARRLHRLEARQPPHRTLQRIRRKHHGGRSAQTGGVGVSAAHAAPQATPCAHASVLAPEGTTHDATQICLHCGSGRRALRKRR